MAKFWGAQKLAAKYWQLKTSGQVLRAKYWWLNKISQILVGKYWSKILRDKILSAKKLLSKYGRRPKISGYKLGTKYWRFKNWWLNSGDRKLAAKNWGRKLIAKYGGRGEKLMAKKLASPQTPDNGTVHSSRIRASYESSCGHSDIWKLL